MVDERMVPLLPCTSVDEIRDFYLPLGFEVTYRQLKHDPAVAPAERLESIVYLAELTIRGSDPNRAAELLIEARSMSLEAGSEAVAALLRQAEELEVLLAGQP